MAAELFVSASPTRVWACVVCYRASAASLAGLLGALAPQVERIVLVDNSAAVDNQLIHLASEKVIYRPMASNSGTAGAMNEAWRLALAADAELVISFDQDSHPDPGMLKQLLGNFRREDKDTRPLAAVGPAWRDARTVNAMRVLKPVLSLRRRHVSPLVSGWVEADHVITSGCLIPAAAYRSVGPYNEALFLDYVDIEWCLRARSQGWRVGIDTGCAMSHTIGDQVITFAGRSLMLHAPVRNYLMLRNHLLLWSGRFIPLGWLLSDLLQVTAKLAGTLLFAPARWQRLGWMARALRDGLRGRGGPPP